VDIIDSRTTWVISPVARPPPTQDNTQGEDISFLEQGVPASKRCCINPAYRSTGGILHLTMLSCTPKDHKQLRLLICSINNFHNLFLLRCFGEDEGIRSVLLFYVTEIKCSYIVHNTLLKL
jgi:hypothetical protein